MDNLHFNMTAQAFPQESINYLFKANAATGATFLPPVHGMAPSSNRLDSAITPGKVAISSGLLLVQRGA